VYTDAYYFGNRAQILQWPGPDGSIRRLMWITWFHWFQPNTESRYGCEVQGDDAWLEHVDYDYLTHSFWTRDGFGNFVGPYYAGPQR
jgi:hypothetical protein